MERRTFVKLTGASFTGLALGLHMPFAKNIAFAATGSLPVNAWLEITTAGLVKMQLPKAEMGQGVYASLPAILADEMDVTLEQIEVIFSSGSAVLTDKETGASPITGGSGSIRGGHAERLRAIGATAREMVRNAAAKKFQVKAAQITLKDGVASVKGSSQQATFGELAELASKETVVTDAPLKKPNELRYIGKPFMRQDIPMKSDGSAQFSMDVSVPGMMHAAIDYSPTFSGEVVNLKELETTAKKLGATHVVGLPAGLAIVANSYWLAQKILDQLSVKYDSPKAHLAESSETISKTLNAAASAADAAIVKEEAWSAEVENQAAKTVEAVYEVPYLAHATMEPMNATASFEKGKVTVWVAHQGENLTQNFVSAALGIKPEDVTVKTMFLGGGFGRRARMDHAIAAALISKAIGKTVKAIYSRETDFRHDGYRPAFVAKLKGGLDKNGTALFWRGQNAGQAIMVSNGWAPPGSVDQSSVEGFSEIHYGIPHQRISHKQVDLHVPVWFWRSVGSSQNAFFVESFIDEMAHAAGSDPYEYRRALLKTSPRHRKVLETAADKASWGKAKRAGFGQGIALAESFGSIVAQVAEVELDASGQPRLTRVVCAVDCGDVINPDIVDAQMMSGVHCGFAAALRGQATIKNGGVREGNFDTYRFISMSEMPKVEVHVVRSGEAYGGVGEPGVPPLAPALCNAIFAATGKRIRKLPIEPSSIS